MVKDSYGYSNYFDNKYMCHDIDEPKGLTIYKDICYPHEAYFLPKYEVVKVTDFSFESQIKNQIQKCKFPDKDFMFKQKSLMFVDSKCSQLTVVKTDNTEWKTFVNKLCLLYDDIHLITNIKYEPIETYKSSTFTGITDGFNCSLKIDDYKDVNYQYPNLTFLEMAILKSIIVISTVFTVMVFIFRFIINPEDKTVHTDETLHKDKMNNIIAEMNKKVFKD